MKNMIASLVTSAIFLSVCRAETTPPSSTTAPCFKGAYVGMSLNTSTAKADLLSTTPTSGEIMVGDIATYFGLWAGYGWVKNQIYFGGEVGHTFENIKINNDQFTLGGGPQTLTRNGSTNVGVRIGYIPVPGTMIYGGVNAIDGKWNALDNNYSLAGITLTGSSRRLSWAPLLGVEIGIGSKVRVRAQYAYEFGPDVKATSSTSNLITQFNSIRNQTFTLGLSFKFGVPPFTS